MTKKKVKKYILPGAALIASSSISLLFVFGAIIGYLGTIFFDKKFIKTGRIEPLTIGLKSWEVHIHHWISGSLAISALCLFGFPSTLPVFWIGTLGGLIFHDLYTDKEWYKIIYKR